MTDLHTLLDSEPVVATAGIEVLPAALDAQGVRVTRTEWKPPVAGTAQALASLAAGGLTAAANDRAVCTDACCASASGGCECGAGCDSRAG